MATLNVHSTGVIHKDIASIRKFDVIVLKEHIVQVMEMTRLPLGMKKYYVLGKDIFTDCRYEDVIPSGHMIQIPNLNKKVYLLINIEDDGYVTLLDEDTCDTRSDLKLKKNSDLERQLLEKYNEGSGQIKIIVLKALNEEHIIEFEIEN